MNDDPVLAALCRRLTDARDALGDEHMTIPAGEIIARDHRRRVRRSLGGTGIACAALGSAVALTALAPGSTARPGPKHAQLAAWTVKANPGGTVTLNLENTSHPARLEHALAKVGIPAVVRSGEVCLAAGRGDPYINTQGFITNSQMGGASTLFAMGGKGPNVFLHWKWTITPAKMPPGGHFVISAIPHAVPSKYIQAAWMYMKSSAPITCGTHMKP
jgi:hypothetical protein